jgi:hypothetical protein
MPVHRFNPGSQRLLKFGPCINVFVATHPATAAAQLKAGGQVQPPIGGFALIDTGASATAVDYRVFQKLQVAPVTTINVNTPSGQQVHPCFPASIIFPGTAIPKLDYAWLASADLQAQGIIALIGRDVLANCVLTYDGLSGDFTIAF